MRRSERGNQRTLLIDFRHKNWFFDKENTLTKFWTVCYAIVIIITRMRFFICTFKTKSCKKSFRLRGFNSYLTFRGFNTLTPRVSNSWFTFRSLNQYHRMRFLICTFKIMSCKKSFGSRGFNSHLTFRGFNILTPRVSNSWFTFRGLNQYHRMQFLICTFKIMSCKKSFRSRGFNSYLTFRGLNTLTPGVSNSWFTFRGLNHYHKFRGLTVYLTRGS